MDANWLLVTDVAQCINMVRGHKGWFTKREAGVEAAIASLTANPCEVNIQAVKTAYQALEDKICFTFREPALVPADHVDALGDVSHEEPISVHVCRCRCIALLEVLYRTL